MRHSHSSPWLALVIILAGFCSAKGRFGDGDPFIDALDAALLNDILEQHTMHQPSKCHASDDVAAKTSFSFDFPGTNADSNWSAEYIPYEASLFQAILSHNDDDANSSSSRSSSSGGKNKSWSIRIGSGGNIYSHYAPNMHGEVIPPQRNVKSPWVDEVQQTVSVALELNQNPNYPQYCVDKNNDAKCYEYYIWGLGVRTPYWRCCGTIYRYSSGNNIICECVYCRWMALRQY